MRMLRTPQRSPSARTWAARSSDKMLRAATGAMECDPTSDIVALRSQGGDLDPASTPREGRRGDAVLVGEVGRPDGPMTAADSASLRRTFSGIRGGDNGAVIAVLASRSPHRASWKPGAHETKEEWPGPTPRED